MNDATDTCNGSHVGTTLLGFALGAAVGAGVALLLAPQSGKRTRMRLAQGVRQSGQLATDALEHARSAAGDTVDQARTAATNLGADVLTAVQAGRDSFTKERLAR